MPTDGWAVCQEAKSSPPSFMSAVRNISGAQFQALPNCLRLGCCAWSEAQSTMLCRCMSMQAQRTCRVCHSGLSVPFSDCHSCQAEPSLALTNHLHQSMEPTPSACKGQRRGGSYTSPSTQAYSPS